MWRAAVMMMMMGRAVEVVFGIARRLREYC